VPPRILLAPGPRARDERLGSRRDLESIAEITTAGAILDVPGLTTAALSLNQRESRQAQTAPLGFRCTIAHMSRELAFAGTKGATIVGFVMMVALSLESVASSAQVSDSEGASWRVVILNSVDPYLPAYIALDDALREAIRAGRKTPVDLYAETLDMGRFPRSLIELDVVALLRKKYRDLKVDVVVTVDELALDMAERYGAELWPGAAIVFMSVSSSVQRGRSLGPRTIGVPFLFEFGSTIDLALKLRPGTRRLAVVAGTSELDRRFLELSRAEIERRPDPLPTEYIVGLTLADTPAAVQALPADAVVLYTSMFDDGAGVPLVPRDVLVRIVEVSPVPVIGVFETFLGHGIVAGSIASYGTQGRRTGEIVVRLLSGEDPAKIGVQAPIVPHCIADWRQLRRWGIDERLLPADCEVRFRDVTVWDRYRLQILAVSAVILAQAALIFALMRNRRRLRRAWDTLADEYARRTQAEGLAARLRGSLARFGRERSLGAMVTTISHEINQPLIAIQNYAQAAKRRIQNDVDDKPKLIALFGKIEGQAERAGAITQRVRSLVGTSDVQLMSVSLCPLFEEVVRTMEPEVGNRGCRIACESAGELPEVLADALPVQLVLVNLLHNAMQSVCTADRYDKQVSVDARRINDREVQVSVTDRGPGVCPDRVPDIFEPLYSGTRDGLGMGLAIAQAIIEAHGGRLWYEPNPAGGAIFRFTLRATGS